MLRIAVLSVSTKIAEFGLNGFSFSANNADFGGNSWRSFCVCNEFADELKAR